MIPTFEQCMNEVRCKRVTYRESDDGHYCVFNYAPDVEIKDLWNDVNIWCRGLIFDCDDTLKPVAVPFKKFWNVGQKPHTHPDILAKKGLPVAVQSKIDGSLGVVFWDRYRDQPRVSTRGSLESEQAKWATQWLNQTIDAEDLAILRSEIFPQNNHWATHLVEIIYPANRIVVAYDFSGLVHLDTILNETGEGDTQHSIRPRLFPRNWRRTESFALTSISELCERAKNLPGMEEGFVCTYSDGLKVKIKGAEYIRLHRLRFDLSPRRVYELFAGAAIDADYTAMIDDLLTAVPDEFAESIRACADNLIKQFYDAKDDVEWHVKTAQHDARGERKRMALYCKTNLQPPLWPAFFAYLDEDSIKFTRALWKAVHYDGLVI